MQPLRLHQQAPKYVQMPVTVAHRRIRRRLCVRKGGRIFGKTTPLASPHIVTTGEVLILRNGHLIDLVEAGELLDSRIWGDAVAIANTDCTLAPRPIAA